LSCTGSYQKTTDNQNRCERFPEQEYQITTNQRVYFWRLTRCAALIGRPHNTPAMDRHIFLVITQA